MPFDLGLYRDPARYPMAPGEVYDSDRLHIEVNDVAQGGPQKISVQLNMSPKRSAPVFAADLGDGLRLVELPAVGEVVRLGGRP